MSWRKCFLCKLTSIKIHMPQMNYIDWSCLYSSNQPYLALALHSEMSGNSFCCYIMQDSSGDVSLSIAYSCQTKQQERCGCRSFCSRQKVVCCFFPSYDRSILYLRTDLNMTSNINKTTCLLKCLQNTLSMQLLYIGAVVFCRSTYFKFHFTEGKNEKWNWNIFSEIIQQDSSIYKWNQSFLFQCSVHQEYLLVHL